MLLKILKILKNFNNFQNILKLLFKYIGLRFFIKNGS